MAQMSNSVLKLPTSTETVGKYQYSPMISERRRNLFPSKDAQIDQELGHIQPLCYSSSSNSETSENEDTNISDYELIEPVDKQGFITPSSKEKECTETMSPLYLSPYTTVDNSVKSRRKFSPSQNLKTPHDTCSKSNFPKLQRNLLEESKTCKKVDESMSSPKHESPELRSGKVRTALFSSEKNEEPPEEDISVPTKSFYSSTREDISDIFSTSRERSLPTKVVPSRTTGYRYDKKFGQINKGVRHKIKKPKQKKLKKGTYGKAAKKMLETNNALNEYIQDIVALRNTTQKLIVNSPSSSKIEKELDPSMKKYLKDLEELNHFGNGYNKLIQHSGRKEPEILEGNKENVPVENRKRHLSPEHTTKKFFKSNRSKPVEKINGICDFEKSNSSENIFLQNTDGFYIETPQNATEHLNLTSQKENTQISNFDSIEIDENEEIVPNMNIDRILTALDDSGTEKPYQNTSSDLFLDSMNIVMNNYDTLSYSKQVVPSYSVENLQNNALTIPQTSFYASNSPMDEISFNRPSKSSSQVILEASISVKASENSIQLHNNILSPISLMCDVTSGLVLSDSPKRGRNLASVLNNMPSAGNTNSFDSIDNLENGNMEQGKLFPIFRGGVKPAPNSGEKAVGARLGGGEKRENKEIRKTPAKKFKRLPEGQMLLDAGQKRFGFVLCNECNTIYHAGDPGDEIQHQNYHDGIHIFRFAGWKNEHVVANFEKNGRIIKVLPTDSKLWLKKAQDLMGFVNRELGCYEMSYDITGSEVYLYIKNRTIVGCVVATVPKFGGHRMLSDFDQVPLCSEQSYPIKCGISHIWVSRNYRKQGIASALMDAVKKTFIFGSVLTNDDIALTSPTEDGMAFATKYFKTKNYLIYYPFE